MNPLPFLTNQENASFPDVYEMFVYFDKLYFNQHLGSVILKWSNRMTLCAGLCEYKGGLCTIKLSKKLLQYRTSADILNTLLHECIHAFLFITKKEIDRTHGPEFHNMMHKINRIGGHQITVYHSFRQEVELYRIHWWQCQRCHRIFKRSRNRIPSPKEWFFAAHSKNCGGNLIKIKGPDKKIDKGHLLGSSSEPSDENVSKDEHGTRLPNDDLLLIFLDDTDEESVKKLAVSKFTFEPKKDQTINLTAELNAQITNLKLQSIPVIDLTTEADPNVIDLTIESTKHSFEPY